MFGMTYLFLCYVLIMIIAQLKKQWCEAVILMRVEEYICRYRSGILTHGIDAGFVPDALKCLYVCSAYSTRH